jgi:trk system potassium uptake protein TrkA
MYIVIVGASRVGIALARWLLVEEQEATIVDRDPERCRLAEDELGSIAVLGDGTEAGVLAKAGVNRADVFVGATGSDDVNLVACQIASFRFGVRHTVALVNITEHQRLFEILGIHVVVDSTSLIVGSIKHSLSELIAERVGDSE